MAFKRGYQRTVSISLISLIDIIFLLLIFFMATINVSTSVSERKQGIYTHKKIDLPELRNKQTGPIQDVLQTLMFQIEHVDPQNPQTPLVVYALWPDIEDTINIYKAMQQAVIRKRCAYFLSEEERKADPDIPDISPYEFITREINQYAERHFRSASPKNYIEVRAIKDTEFMVINHILKTCAELDDRIPRIYIRTLSGELGTDVF